MSKIWLKKVMETFPKIWYKTCKIRAMSHGHQKNGSLHKFSIRSNIKQKQERQIVARYARLTPSCKAGACTGQNSSMKNNKGH